MRSTVAILVVAACIAGSYALTTGDLPVSFGDLSEPHGMVRISDKRNLDATYWSPARGVDGHPFGVRVVHSVTPDERGVDFTRKFEITTVGTAQPQVLLSYNKAAGSRAHSFRVLDSDIEYNEDEMNDIAVQDADMEEDLSFGAIIPQKVTAENAAFTQLVNTKEAMLLPLMSRELGLTHSVNAREHPLSMPLHTLAMHIAKVHNIADIVSGKAAQAQAAPAGMLKDKQTWGKLKGCMNKVGMCKKFTCGASQCTKGCATRPLTAFECKGGNCGGMCGPSGCNCCWDWICGDCCWHKGCYDMREMCKGEGYGLFSCWTAKGVMWGRKTADNYKACGGAIIPPSEAAAVAAGEEKEIAHSHSSASASTSATQRTDGRMTMQEARNVKGASLTTKLDGGKLTITAHMDKPPGLETFPLHMGPQAQNAHLFNGFATQHSDPAPVVPGGTVPHASLSSKQTQTKTHTASHIETHTATATAVHSTSHEHIAQHETRSLHHYSQSTSSSGAEEEEEEEEASDAGSESGSGSGSGEGDEGDATAVHHDQSYRTRQVVRGTSDEVRESVEHQDEEQREMLRRHERRNLAQTDRERRAADRQTKELERKIATQRAATQRQSLRSLLRRENRRERNKSGEVMDMFRRENRRTQYSRLRRAQRRDAARVAKSVKQREQREALERHFEGAANAFRSGFDDMESREQFDELRATYRHAADEREEIQHGVDEVSDDIRENQNEDEQREETEAFETAVKSSIKEKQTVQKATTEIEKKLSKETRKTTEKARKTVTTVKKQLEKTRTKEAERKEVAKTKKVLERAADAKKAAKEQAVISKEISSGFKKARVEARSGVEKVVKTEKQIAAEQKEARRIAEVKAAEKRAAEKTKKAAQKEASAINRKLRLQKELKARQAFIDKIKANIARFRSAAEAHGKHTVDIVKHYSRVRDARMEDFAAVEGRRSRRMSRNMRKSAIRTHMRILDLLKRFTSSQSAFAKSLGGANDASAAIDAAIAAAKGVNDAEAKKVEEEQKADDAKPVEKKAVKLVPPPAPVIPECPVGFKLQGGKCTEVVTSGLPKVN